MMKPFFIKTTPVGQLTKDCDEITYIKYWPHPYFPYYRLRDEDDLFSPQTTVERLACGRMANKLLYVCTNQLSKLSSSGSPVPKTAEFRPLLTDGDPTEQDSRQSNFDHGCGQDKHPNFSYFHCPYQKLAAEGAETSIHNVPNRNKKRSRLSIASDRG